MSDERDGTNSALAIWTGGLRCEVRAGGFDLVVDEPTHVAGGGGTGPMPTDLLLASLSSCYALALAWAARKRGFELPDLQVEAIGTYAGPRLSSFELVVRTTLPDERLRPLLEPASRVCYISNTLARTPEITIRVA